MRRCDEKWLVDEPSLRDFDIAFGRCAKLRPVTPLLHIIVFLATVLWCHAAVLALDWLGVLRRAPHHEKVGLVVNLLGAFVPVVVIYIVVVFAGAILGLPSMVAFLAVVVPAGFVVALRIDLADEFPSTWPREQRRILLTVALALLVIGYRQLRG